MVVCECGLERGPLHGSAGACPACGSRRGEWQRCDECPHRKVEQANRETVAGALFQMAVRADALIQARVRIGLDDLAADEAEALLILVEERNRYQDEKQSGAAKPEFSKLKAIPKTNG
jgi:hypothetical protein